MAQLKRTLTLIPLTLYGVGTILGAGIYVIVSEVAAESGGLFPISFIIATLIAAICAFTYAELTSRFPKAAGEAVYVKEAFGFPPLTILVGYAVAATGLLSASTIIKGFYGYLSIFVNWPEWLCTSGLVLAMGLVALKGIKESVWFVTVVTLIEITGLLLVIYIGSPNIPSLFGPESPIDLGAMDINVFAGAFIAFFAFIGFEDMVNMAEETQKPERTLPIAILLALVVASLFYLGVSLSALASLDLQSIITSKAPLALVVERNSSLPSETMGLIGMVAIINGGLVQVIMVSRLVYGMAKIGRAPKFFGTVSEKTHTPIYSTLLTIGFIWALISFFNIEYLARGTSFVILFVFLLMNLALIWIRKVKKMQKALFHVPLAVPIIGALSSVFLIIAAII